MTKLIIRDVSELFQAFADLNNTHRFHLVHILLKVWFSDCSHCADHIYSHHQTEGEQLWTWGKKRGGTKSHTEQIFKSKLKLCEKKTINAWEETTRNQRRTKELKGLQSLSRESEKSENYFLFLCDVSECQDRAKTHRENQSLFCRRHNDSVTIEIGYL